MKKKRGRNKFIKAIDDLTLNIFQGDKVGLIGKNGSGKSTLMRILSGITKPSAGEDYIKRYSHKCSAGFFCISIRSNSSR